MGAFYAHLEQVYNGCPNRGKECSTSENAAAPHETKCGAIQAFAEQTKPGLSEEEASAGRPRLRGDAAAVRIKGYVPQADMCEDVHGNLLTNECEVIERWKQYYDEHLNGNAAKHEGGTAVDLGARAEDDTLPAPDLQEVEEEIGRLKSTKAADVDQLPSELLKHGGEALARAMYWVIAKIWEDEILPEE